MRKGFKFTDIIAEFPATVDVVGNVRPKRTVIQFGDFPLPNTINGSFDLIKFENPVKAILIVWKITDSDKQEFYTYKEGFELKDQFIDIK